MASSTSSASFFKPRQYVLIVSDDNSGGGPIAASYDPTSSCTPTAVPEPFLLALILRGAAGLAGWARVGARALAAGRASTR